MRKRTDKLRVPVKKTTKHSSSSSSSSSKRAIKKKINEGIKPFPIVGIGASAGGLEAFSIFLQNLPPNLGMAYVYVQHLSPTHESFLPEILERKTKMKVHKMVQNMEVEKDSIYVIPPKYGITITDGTLKLIRRPRGRGESFFPIDDFMISLASAYHENAIGIILSGTGTDGTFGLKAIKIEGGITFAQDDSSRYEGMPHHAAVLGYVDFIMPPDKIAKELSLLIKHPYTGVTAPNDFFLESKNELKQIQTIIHRKYNINFSHYKQSTVNRRIMRRMLLNRLNTLSDYALLVKDNKTEADSLYQDLLITVTDFFRDKNLYEALTSKLFPALIKNRRPNDAMRIWIPGCATGEEAISIAIVLLEYLGEKALSTPIQIFATDLNEKSIERARTGIYTKNAVRNVSTQRLNRFFTKIDGSYQVAKAIRDICIFAPHNLLSDPPFSRIDIISCQNVLIYMEALPQNSIMHSFHYALKPNGFLLLGNSETIGSAIDLFDQASKEYKIYTKRNVTANPQLDFPMGRYLTSTYKTEREEEQGSIVVNETDIEKETEKLLLNRYVPASVLINKDFEILRFRGSTSGYLEPASGKASLNLMKMVKEDIAYELRTTIQRAKKENQTVKRDGLQVGINGNIKDVTIEVIPFKAKTKDNYFLVIFKENGNGYAEKHKSISPLNKRQDEKDRLVSRLEGQLKEARENMKVMNEEFEATREEIQSANEEVLSSNEELQSINEELETSKEELQSTNEELTTINEELHNRNMQLKDAYDYSKAIQETLHEGLLLLDNNLRVKTANKGFYYTFKTDQKETEGCFLYELGNSQWDIPELRRQLKLVQTTNTHVANFEVEHTFPNIGDKTMLLNAQKINSGHDREPLLLLAIQDITERKHIELKLKENEERFRLLIQNSFDIITVLDQEGIIKYESPAVEAILKYRPNERVGRNIFHDSFIHPDDRYMKKDLMSRILAQTGQNVQAELRMQDRNGEFRTIDAVFRNQLHDTSIQGIVATFRDITDRKLLEQQKDEFIGVASHELKTPVTSIKAYTQILEDMFLKAKDTKSADLLARMNGQVDRLTTLIIDLLDFTRIEGGKLKFREENYDLNKLVSEVIEEMQRASKQHKIVKKLSKPVLIWGDRYRTGQVLTNLLSNAIKYSPEAKKIIVATEIAARQVPVSVQDFGIGIEKEMVNKVFERFFRITEPTLNTFPGLGLGLYIAAEIIHRQGGKISVTSEKNNGSTFRFTLPLKRK